MKELTIEEKAKAYDNALKRAREWSETKNGYYTPKELCEEIFHELQESEDEKIKENLIGYIKGISKNEVCEETKDSWITWLEKQGEPVKINPTEFDTRLQALIGKFDNLPKEELIGSLSFWLNVVQNGAYKPDEKQDEKKPYGQRKECFGCQFNYAGECKGSCAMKRSEQKSAEWSKWDELQYKVAHNLCENSGHTITSDWLESLKDRVYSKQEWKQENTDDLTDFENAMMHIGGSFFGQYAGLDPNDTDAIKEQASLLLKLVPTKEWSEEDKNAIQVLKDIVRHSDEINEKIYTMSLKEKLYDWIKSLKQRIV